MTIHDLDTPALICDLDVLWQNLENMSSHCHDLGIALRPHTKTHKNPEIAHWQIQLGACGICCQKLGDAEVMAAAGIKDILIPFNIVGPIKVERLLRLVRRVRIAVSCDSEETVRGISELASRECLAVRCLVECDTGGRRCGVDSPDSVVRLACFIEESPGTTFEGLLTYPSRPDARNFIEQTTSLLRDAGLEVTTISGGGTGRESVSKELGCTEHRSGSYAFEGMTRISGSQMLAVNRCPVRVIATVVSVPKSDRAIIDGGQKTFTSYPPNPYGVIVEHPDAVIHSMSVEHGHIDTSRCQNRLRVGERISVIPLHAEMTTNLHDVLYGVRKDRVEVVWKIAGRGRVQ